MKKAYVLFLFLFCTLPLSTLAAKPTHFTALAVSGQTTSILQDDTSYIDFGLGGWGAKWAYCAFSGKSTVAGNTAKGSNIAKIGTTALALNTQAEQQGKKNLTLTYDLTTPTDVETTMIMVSVELNSEAFRGGSILVETTKEEPQTVSLPLGQGILGKQVTRCTLTDQAGQKTKFTFDPACDIATDGQLRILLAEGPFLANQPTHQIVTIELPSSVEFYTSPASYPIASTDDWYTFTPSKKVSANSEMSVANWLEKPAGKHGRISRTDEDLIYNGAPIKLWGINNCYGTCAPDKSLAEDRAAFYAQNGINSVRLHKYADGAGWAGIQSANSFAELDASGLAKMDYYVAQLKEHGIYTKLSSTFGVKLGSADKGRVPFADELGLMKYGRIATGGGSVYLSTEIQDLQIEQIVNILTHKNEHTGLTYAQDPAIAVVELFNEDSILFHGTMGVITKSPTLRNRTGKTFSAWLKKRYTTEENLVAAWGENALNSFTNEGFTNESWEAQTILPLGNPWFYDPDQLDGSQIDKKARLLDTMLFLYELQNDFYDRYVQAIRDTGYTGEIIASNWQAGRAFSHYYNLHSDVRIGLIDRHNYIGGRNGSKIKTATMISTPGSKILSSGMQQVSNRPFMLSEWIHVSPTEWGAEGVALIGAYGMGLQGWDVSYIFENRDTGTFADKLNHDQWEATAPQIIGLFPAVARQVLRSDIQESTVTAARYVHLPSLHEGKLGFNDKMKQAHDFKSFTSDKVPTEALAVARCVVDFTDDYQDTPLFDMTPYRTDGGLTSSTQELFWKAGVNSTDGYFTINTPATKAVVGFSAGKTLELGDITIEPETRFSAIYVTAKELDKNLTTSSNLLVTAIARARNTGMRVIGDALLVKKGTAPIVMEPVKATITLKREGAKKVIVLNHDGVRTGKTIPIHNGRFTIDGAKDKSCYYLITF